MKVRSVVRREICGPELCGSDMKGYGYLKPDRWEILLQSDLPMNGIDMKMTPHQGATPASSCDGDG